MLTLPPSVRMFVCTQPTDMRRGFDGLSTMVEQVLKRDPFCGHLFVFRNRRKDRIKVLYWCIAWSGSSGDTAWNSRVRRCVAGWPPAPTCSVRFTD